MKDKRKIAKTAFKTTARTTKVGWWVFFIWVFTFIFATLMTLLMSNIMQTSNIYIAVILLLVIILISILFDIIGTAVTAAEVIPFNSMASRKVYGAKTAIWLIKHSDKVSNFCNDVIGDICGIVSGAASAYIMLKIGILFDMGSKEVLYTEALLGGFVAALTIGGKSLGKKVAINSSNSVIYKVAVVIGFFKRR